MVLNWIAKIKKAFISKIPGMSDQAQFANAEGFAGDKRDFQIYGPCNEDFSPPNDVLALQANFGRDSGFIILHAYSNQKITPVALPGERRLYSTNEAGDTVQSQIHLKQDGAIFIDNGAVTITANPSGLLQINTTGNSEITSAKTVINNDVEIDGDLLVSGTSELQGTTTIETKTFLNHTHTGVQSGGSNTGGVS